MGKRRPPLGWWYDAGRVAAESVVCYVIKDRAYEL